MSDSVQQIKDKLSIIDVISPYVELHKAGKNYKGKSPFSAEKTPSFYVSPDRGMYYCFSTSQGGDMFTFVQAMEGVDFKEALKQLAEKAGVELVPEDPKKKTERERWHAALKDATEFYTKQLHNHPEAEAYLGKRGVEAETIQTWQIGYAPGPPTAGWREVKDELESKGYTKDELLKVGLIKTTEGGKEPFDVFRDRIMFPMNDTSGKVVAFSGRLLGQNDKAPKYVNSPETELYKKSELLYGYDKAKHGIRQLDFSLIVEGQFDVVMSHQAGYHNAVAVSGTALTPHHVKLLERLSDRVVLALDADKAGIAAMKRAADVMLRRGLDVKVAEVPEGKDPADLVAEGKDALKKVVGKSVHVIEFLLHVLKRSESNSRTLKLKAREEVLPFILLLPNRIDQEHFVDIVAKEIGSTADAIRFELDRLREEAPLNTNTEEKKEEEAVMATSLLEKKYTYVLAAKEVQSELKSVIEKEIGKFEENVELPEVDPTQLSKTTFELSESFHHRKEKDIYEEIAAELNMFHQESAKKILANIRAEHEDWMTNKEAVLLHQKAEAMRSENPYSSEMLEEHKD